MKHADVMLAVFILQQVVLTYGEVVQYDFTMLSTIEGSGGTSGDTSGMRTVKGHMDCAAACMAMASESHVICTGFSTAETPGGEYLCSMSTNKDKLPAGYRWTLYRIPVCVGEQLTLDPCNSACYDSTLLLQRKDGTLGFKRNWSSYKSGFSNNKNYWLGLDTLHALTSSGDYQLCVDIEAWDGKSFWAHYWSFSVGPESDNYRLSVSGYDGNSTAGDSLTDHDGMQFTTYDTDNDVKVNGNCASILEGGWWYNACLSSHPTGLYLLGGVQDNRGIRWKTVPGYNGKYSFKYMLLKIITLK